MVRVNQKVSRFVIKKHRRASKVLLLYPSARPRPLRTNRTPLIEIPALLRTEYVSTDLKATRSLLGAELKNKRRFLYNVNKHYSAARSQILGSLSLVIFQCPKHARKIFVIKPTVCITRCSKAD